MTDKSLQLTGKSLQRNQINIKSLKEKFIKGLIYFSVFLTFGIVLWILVHIVFNGFVKANKMNILSGDESILPILMNTFYIVVLAVFISTPIGIWTAIYLNEYAGKSKLVHLIRFAIQSLAGIPSIIFGLFGMIVFVVGLNLNWSILSGALTLSIMILPIIIKTTEEALKTVPLSIREGSLALGASKLRTIKGVVIPSALPGIIISIILSIGRIVGETAAVYLTAGMVPRLAGSPLESGRTLSVHLYILAKEGVSFESAYFTATILVIFILFVNMISNKLAKKYNKKLKGN
ncbi:phosphate ABC transporter permease PstA [Anaerosalibacter massiliensis]|uniref:Phosphate transport system permease protein PstA n=1 Tax=Anaerosalibacter massiliensis TaxID=1347392 RepID=A0A9X2MKG0_9FIRM|nr:phosphate ABC transporter permease PstA [Anaerosalibacter massiliensis]MCR2042906.1 phosphate ABC transporter permease PstA [Anaerosalibacter massiliensis]